jgi:hypothetical protein
MTAQVKKMLHTTNSLFLNPLQIEQRLFPIHRAIEKCYASLPWPSGIKQVSVVTHTPSGLGDISAAAKVISLMQRICPELIFDWVLIPTSTNKISAKKALDFLTEADQTKISVRTCSCFPNLAGPADLLLGGPAKSWDTAYLEDRIWRRVKGPRFDFMEIAETARNLNFDAAKYMAKIAKRSELPMNYAQVHKEIFPYEYNILGVGGMLPMGLLEGTGVLLDSERMKASLSRSSCCPNYLSKIEDEQLRRDIFSAMGADSADTFYHLDYDHYSFNFGYARYKNSWKKFIDCVAIHEGEKEVVIVFNYQENDTKEEGDLFASLFSRERLSFLLTRGYGKITLKTEEEESIVWLVKESTSYRQLKVIGRRHFPPQDMKWLQLAAERLLATGDNSAVESWCARCKLYVYEDVNELFGCKWLFLQQQVDLAQTISPALGKLLALFGGDQRYYPGPLNMQFTTAQMNELEALLATPDLGEKTLQFCQIVTTNYPFDKALEGAIKRCVWNYLLPALQQIEADALDEAFRVSCLSLLKGDLGQNCFPLRTDLTLLAERVKHCVTQHASI